MRLLAVDRDGFHIDRYAQQAFDKMYSTKVG